MVLTRSQIRDSPCKIKQSRIEKKSTPKKLIEEPKISCDEGNISSQPEASIINDVRLGTIPEEEESLDHYPRDSPVIQLEKLRMDIHMKTHLALMESNTTIENLSPIMEESDEEKKEEIESLIESVSELTNVRVCDKESERGETSKNIPETKARKKHRFYFPPAKSLIPQNITATSIDAGMEIKDTYVNVKYTSSGKKKINDLYSIQPVSSKDSQLKDSIITPDFETRHAVPLQKSIRQQRKERKELRESDAGKDWFNFKPPEVTEEIKRDLEILKMRSILDPKRFYKHNDRKTLPRYFQVGKIVDNAVDFYSSRVPKKQRKPNLTEELLADAEFKQYQKRKYNEIQMKQKALGAKRRRVKHGKFSKRKKETAG